MATNTKKKPALPKLTRAQARAVKAAADKLTTSEKIFNKGQKVLTKIRDTKIKVKAPTTEEMKAEIWGLHHAVINGEVSARTGIALIEATPLGILRLTEARERDNGKRKGRRKVR